MNRCAVEGCDEPAWTHWRGYDLCKPCSDAASMWAVNTTTMAEAAAVVDKIAQNLHTYGNRTGPEELNR
jgi:hypothetical protein